MARWSNEVQASVDPGVVVVVQDPFYLQFFLQVGFKLSINELNDGLIALAKRKKKKALHLTVRELNKQDNAPWLAFKKRTVDRFHFPFSTS